MRIHQIAPSVAFGDAISNHIFEMDARFRQWGHEAQIYVQLPKAVHPDRVPVHSYEDLEPFLSNKDNLFIYHYGIYHPSIELLQQAQGRKILIYHNITPAHFFAGWNDHNESICNIGRTYLQCLVDCDLGIGDSEYNRQELVAVGFVEEDTAVLPIFLTLDTFKSISLDENLARTMQQNKQTNWLAVGRIVPSKAIENLIRIFYVYRTYLNPNAHLHIVGSSHITKYKALLLELIAELNLNDHVTFPGKVSEAQLKTYYKTADLYITASQHEGFCVPLIESMYFDLPILAHNSSAIPETLGEAGILFSNLGYEEVAAMAHLILSDPHLKQQIIAAQQKRLQTFAPDHVEATLAMILKKFM